MSTRRIAIIIVVAAVVVGGAIVLRPGASEPTKLVPAWQLTPHSAYRGMQFTDPFVSWAPDSRSLLTSVYTLNSMKPLVLWWKVGEDQLRLVTAGVSPNYYEDDRRFLYLKTDPVGIYSYDLTTAKEEQVLPELTDREPWSEAKAFTYDPDRHTLALRLTDYTQFYLPGTEEYDLDGKHLGPAITGLDSEIMAVAKSTSGRYEASIIDTQRRGRYELQLTDRDHSDKVLATGYLGAIAWNPAEDVLAYGDVTAVKVYRPKDGRRMVVARFASPANKTDSRHVSRLKWSPDGHYLAVLVYVPNEAGDYPLIYVLNMSKFRWN